MPTRIAILAAALLHLLAFRSTAPAAEPLRDPWKGFGLGSWVEFEGVDEETRDGKSEKHGGREKHTVHSLGEGIWVQVTRDDGSTSRRMHVHGALPEEMGLKKTETSNVQFVADGKQHTAVATQYVSNPDDPRLELLAKPFPEIMRQGGLKGEKGTTVQLTLWEVEGLDIPYSEMQLPGRDLALGPHVVHADIKLLQSDKNGKVMARGTHRRTVRSLDAPLTIGGKKVKCVQVEIHREEEKPAAGGKADIITLQGQEWLSNDVPGRNVKISATMKAKDWTGTSTRTAVAFAAVPVQDLELKKLPPLAQRPVIPGNDWNGLHLGAWKARFVANIRREGMQAFSSITRVVAIRDGGEIIVESRNLDGDPKRKEPSYEVVKVGDDAREKPWSKLLPLGAGKEKLTFGKEELPAHWKAFRTADHKPEPSDRSRPARSLVQAWWPEKPADQHRLLPFDGAVQVLKHDLIPDAVGSHRSCELSRLVDSAWECEVKGKKVAAAVVVSYETQGDEKTYPYKSWKAAVYSEQVPGGHLIDVDRDLHNQLVSYSFLMDWGEFEDRAPATPEEVIAHIRATKLFPRQALAKLDTYMNDEAFSKEFVETKDGLELRLLKMGEAAVQPSKDN